LSDAEVLRLLEIIEAEQNNIAWIHFVPACGTASMAREKKLRTLEEAGVSVRAPEPFRTEDYPPGLQVSRAWTLFVFKLQGGLCYCNRAFFPSSFGKCFAIPGSFQLGAPGLPPDDPCARKPYLG